ncbi:MAG: dienelactone hydrolase family protein [Verrucomicrobiae bacterium]|nr:dienelactone hydrolase family protein [Verrucomicrobiae bacterium]
MKQLSHALILFVFILSEIFAISAFPQAFLNTKPLVFAGDIASNMVVGIDKFLLMETMKSIDERKKYWNRDFSSIEKYNKSIQQNRDVLARILGLLDARPTNIIIETFFELDKQPIIASGKNFIIQQIRWSAFGNVHGEGLLLSPTADAPPKAEIIAIPDSDNLPEELCGIVTNASNISPYARNLASSGCRVFILTLIDRSMGPHKGRAYFPAREFIHRPAFELGRTLFGYEVQKVLALVDWISQNSKSDIPIGVVGYGDGGLIALFAAALDTRIKSLCVSGAFDDRLQIWQEPLDRNLFGFLEQFGGAELASMVAPRKLVIEHSPYPNVNLKGEKGGAPGRLVAPSMESVQGEIERAMNLVKPLGSDWIDMIIPPGNSPKIIASETLALFVHTLGVNINLEVDNSQLEIRYIPDAKARQARLFKELDEHTQQILNTCSFEREAFWKSLDYSSLEAYSKSIEKHRRFFRDKIIGWFEQPLLEPNPRSRLSYSNAAWLGYEIVLDVFPDVIACGILLVPTNIKTGEKRPVVVCQHGLEGRPQETITGDHRAYHDFSAKLAELGYVVFAPQNPYIFGHRFRTLQRKANPLGKTLFSIITPQHQQIINWLKTLPFVDGEKIGFYGLSYGGKTAIRVPAILTDYKFSICSADFNEWVWKNASTVSPYSYVWMGEYEIFEFNLGNTFNYAEMAALIAPRPFMVERGHFDNVAPDETVAYEYAKVRRLYSAILKIPEKTAIEWFVGPHTINGKGTFEFIKQQFGEPSKK